MPETPEAIDATLESEECLLGSLIIEASGVDSENYTALKEVAAILTPADFHDRPLHGRLFWAMLQCPTPPNQVVLAQTLHSMGKLQDGDCAAMHHLIAVVPCSLDYMEYARAVKGYSEARGGQVRPKYKDAV